MNTGPFLIRIARLEEKRALEDLQRRASLANAFDRPHILANPDVIDLPAPQLESGLVFVAEHEGRLAGFAALLAGQPDEYELDGLFVEPHLWRSGIGFALVEHSVATVRGQGATLLRVIANPHALGFYQRCQFQKTGEAETLFGPAILMSRKL